MKWLKNIFCKSKPNHINMLKQNYLLIGNFENNSSTEYLCVSTYEIRRLSEPNNTSNGESKGNKCFCVFTSDNRLYDFEQKPDGWDDLKAAFLLKHKL